jgi:hypothetical protein
MLCRTDAVQHTCALHMCQHHLQDGMEQHGLPGGAGVQKLVCQT